MNNVEDKVVFDTPKPLKLLAEDFIREYRANRYLKMATREELINREADIVANLFKFDEAQKKYVPIFNIDENGFYRGIRNLDWLRMATEVREEFRLREELSTDLPSLKNTYKCECRLSESKWAVRPDLFQQSQQSLDSYKLPELLFRYQKKEYNTDFMNKGRMAEPPSTTSPAMKKRSPTMWTNMLYRCYSPAQKKPTTHPK